MKNLFAGILAVTLICGCSRKAAVNTEVSPQTDMPAVEASGIALGFKSSKPVNAIPRATAFRMTGDYSDNVAITMNGDDIIYFPAPTDISTESRPVSLGDGWWLNRQGISANSVFTKYTFQEYSRLTQAPSVKELKASVIPGARVSEMKVLPFSINEAYSKIEEIRQYLNITE